MEQVSDILAQKTIVIKDKQLRNGFAQVPTPVIRYPKLSVGAKVAYSLLLSYAWQDEFCFPGQERMAEDCGINARTLRRRLNELKIHKLVEWKRRGITKTNIYYILPVPDGIIEDYEKRKKVLEEEKTKEFTSHVQEYVRGLAT